MPTVLILAGTAFELVGLGFVFAELSIIRSHEFGVPTPWARVRARIRRLLRRSQTVQVGAAVEVSTALSAHAKVRPGDAGPNATDAERIARLERYVGLIDQDLGDLRRAVDSTRQEITEATRRVGDELRGELARRHAERLELRRPAIVREAVGAGCVLLGLVLGTIGNLI